MLPSVPPPWSAPPRKLCPKCSATLVRSKMLTAPSGVPADPLKSHAACPKAKPVSPGDCPKCAATVARSTMLMTMCGAGKGPVSDEPLGHVVQYHATLPASWNLYHSSPQGGIESDGQGGAAGGPH